MLRIALERGLSSLIAQWMLDGRADGVLDRVARAGALPPEEIEALRVQTAARLQKVREEGAPYADMVTDALGGMRSALPELATMLRTTDTSSARVIAAAVADELARRAAEAARSAAQQWQPSNDETVSPDAPPAATAAPTSAADVNTTPVVAVVDGVVSADASLPAQTAAVSRDDGPVDTDANDVSEATQ